MRAPLIALGLLLLPAVAPAQERGWPAKYHSISGIPCCSIGKKGEDHSWDCAVVPFSQGAELTIGSVTTIDLPSGPQQVRINAVFPSETENFVVCSPGCLFVSAGV